jgi:hypothetical protein
MKINNLVVADIKLPMDVVGTGNNRFENALILPCRICKEHLNSYIDLETGKKYSKKEELGRDRVVSESVVSLFDYYNVFGAKKDNDHDNKEEVYSKVKKLKKAGKI